jgi:hypothetical protein
VVPSGTTQGYFHSSLFAFHINLEYQNFTYNNASSNNFDFDNEKIHYTSRNSMIHNLSNDLKIMDYENHVLWFLESKFSPFKFILNKRFKGAKLSNINL